MVLFGDRNTVLPSRQIKNLVKLEHDLKIIVIHKIKKFGGPYIFFIDTKNLKSSSIKIDLVLIS